MSRAASKKSANTKCNTVKQSHGQTGETNSKNHAVNTPAPYQPLNQSSSHFPVQPCYITTTPCAQAHIPAQPLHNLGCGPQPLFGWASVTPLNHSYGQPKYWRHQKPDYRRFCYSVGKAEVPYAALPGGPLYGYPTYMSEQLMRRW